MDKNSYNILYHKKNLRKINGENFIIISFFKNKKKKKFFLKNM